MIELAVEKTLSPQSDDLKNQASDWLNNHDLPAELADELREATDALVDASGDGAVSLAQTELRGLMDKIAEMDRGFVPIVTLKGHKKEVHSVAFAPDRMILASSSSKEIKLWNVETGKLTVTLLGGGAHTVVFSPDGSTLLTANPGEVRTWDVDTGEAILTIPGESAGFFSAAFSPDGKVILSGGFEEIRLWSAETGDLIRRQTGLRGPVRSVAFSPDGAIFACGAYGEVDLFDAESGESHGALPGHSCSVASVIFSPNGKLLATRGVTHVREHPAVKLWDVQTRALRRTFKRGGFYNPYAVAFSPDGDTIATSSLDHTIVLWDTHHGDVKQMLTGHEYGVYALAYSSDGRTLASGSGDNTVMMWHEGFLPVCKSQETLQADDGTEAPVRAGALSAVRSEAAEIARPPYQDRERRPAILAEPIEGHGKPETEETDGPQTVTIPPAAEQPATASVRLDGEQTESLHRTEDERAERERHETEHKRQEALDRAQREWEEAEHRRQQEERERRRREAAEHAGRLEEERTTRILERVRREELRAQRRAKGQCEECGVQLGLFDKLRGRIRCGRCR